MIRHFTKGQRVTLRADRAEAYGEAKETVFTVLATKAHAHYNRNWVYLVERKVGNNCVDSCELRAV